MAGLRLSTALSHRHPGRQALPGPLRPWLGAQVSWQEAGVVFGFQDSQNEGNRSEVWRRDRCLWKRAASSKQTLSTRCSPPWAQQMPAPPKESHQPNGLHWLQRKDIRFRAVVGSGLLPCWTLGSCLQSTGRAWHVDVRFITTPEQHQQLGRSQQQLPEPNPSNKQG